MKRLQGIKERNHHLDNTKAFLIFLVVSGHFIEMYRKEYFLLSVIYKYIYSFHMPLFIIISGYMSKNLNNKRNLEILKTYLVWQIIASGGKYFLGYLSIKHFAFFRPSWTLWYLLSLFLWRAMLPIIKEMKYPIITSLNYWGIKRLFL